MGGAPCGVCPPEPPERRDRLIFGVTVSTRRTRAWREGGGDGRDRAHAGSEGEWCGRAEEDADGDRYPDRAACHGLFGLRFDLLYSDSGTIADRAVGIWLVAALALVQFAPDQLASASGGGETRPRPRQSRRR